ncbi:zinc ribbon domain-containing protein [Thiohalorhabdus sp.]|uniref:zinc ribbon domain-containing protein n=1 Tax=Thiohalorhabdus sp. TaxID=3094134 RepID=UPI002FC31450
MPTYDYRCPANGEVVEVQHPMSEKLTTWGEVCEYSGRECGATAADQPVERLISGGSVVSSDSLSNPEPSPCAGGMCGL